MSHVFGSNTEHVTFASGAVDGTGVGARVTGADGCKLGRVTRKVPYLLFSPLILRAPVLSPVD